MSDILFVSGAVHPALPLFIAAFTLLFTQGLWRNLICILFPIIGALNLYYLPSELLVESQLFDLQLTPLRIDNLSLLFGYLFHLAAFIGAIYALHLKDRLQDFSAFSYAASAVGAVFSGDFLTLFIFWELLALTSCGLIIARKTEQASKAAIRYLSFQILSGLLLLAGALSYIETTDFSFNAIELDNFAAALILIAFGIKASFPFLHSWLTDAYPEATPTGTVFLSAFTTKVAIYALARGFAGSEILIYIGAVMACFPIFYAVIENDLRRVLAYSLINQLGFMVVGIGIGTDLAVNGAVAHAFSDVIFKGLLLMSMGAVLEVTGESRGSELGGLFSKMPKTATLCMIGAASISAFPLFSGFVSKSIIMSASLLEGYETVWLALLFASAGVFHHAGIKIPFFAFFHEKSRFVDDAHEPPANMLLAMTIAALLCITIGCSPQQFYQLLPYPIEYSAYDASHILAQLQLLAFSALAFTWLKLSHIYPPELRSVNLDIDWLYRRMLPSTAKRLETAFTPLFLRIRELGQELWRKMIALIATHHGQHGILARTWPTGSMVLWVSLLLSFTLLLYYR